MTIKPNMDSKLGAFHQQVLALLTQRARSGTAAPGLPHLSIAIFEGTPVALETALRLAAGRALFFLYVPVPNQPPPPDADLARAYFTCPMDDHEFYEEKTALLAQLLPEDIKLHVGKEMEARHGEKIARIHKALQDAAYNRTLARLRSLIQMRNSLWNLPAIVRRNSGPLPISPDSAVAVICGAGPSLNRQTAWLKSIAHRAIVVSVGHALPVLLRAGVNPDIVVEGDPYAYRNWPDAMPAQTSLLVALPELAPEVVARFQRICWCQGGDLPFTDFCAKHHLALTPVTLNKTVTIHAMDAVIRAGARNVVLIGQDLSILPSGQAYADESQGEHGCQKDAVLSTPGNDAPLVPTNRNFQVVKQAIEEYIHGSGAALGQALRIMNATLGGARIEGARRVSEAEVEALLPKQKTAWPPVARPAPGIQDSTPFSNAGRDMRALAATQELIVQICRKLARMLDQPAPSASALARLQHQLQAGIHEEDRQRNAAPVANWANLILGQADLVTTPHPSTPDPNAPAVQLDFLRARYRFSAETLTEMAGLFEHAAQSIAAPNAAPPTGSPRTFQAFRTLALERVRISNREYAEWLAARAIQENMERFRLYWADQFLPRLEVKVAREWRPFTAFLDMRATVTAELNTRLAAAMADPEHAAVAFLCPGNWAHPALLGRAAPQLPMLIMDPWPELFSCLCDHVCFINELRRDTLICGLRDDLTTWPQLFQQRVRTWTDQRRKIYCFVSAAAADLPEMAGWRNRLEELLAQAGVNFVMEGCRPVLSFTEEPLPP